MGGGRPVCPGILGRGGNAKDALNILAVGGGMIPIPLIWRS